MDSYYKQLYTKKNPWLASNNKYSSTELSDSKGILLKIVSNNTVIKCDKTRADRITM